MLSASRKVFARFGGQGINAETLRVLYLRPGKSKMRHVLMSTMSHLARRDVNIALRLVFGYLHIIRVLAY